MKTLKLVKSVVLTEVHVGGTDANDVAAVADIQRQSQGARFALPIHN
jgi:hypothetical protein